MSTKNYTIQGVTFYLRPEGGEKNRQVAITGADAQKLVGSLPANLIPQTPSDRLVENGGQIGFLPASAIDDPRVASMIGQGGNTAAETPTGHNFDANESDEIGDED